MVVAGGPRLGDARAGGAVGLVGLQGAVVAGGLTCVALTCLVGALVPRFRAYDARRPHP